MSYLVTHSVPMKKVSIVIEAPDSVETIEIPVVLDAELSYEVTETQTSWQTAPGPIVPTATEMRVKLSVLALRDREGRFLIGQNEPRS